MAKCIRCGAENPPARLSCAVCGAALTQEEKKAVLLGSMGGRKYSPPAAEPERPEEDHPAELSVPPAERECGEASEAPGESPAPEEETAAACADTAASGEGAATPDAAEERPDKTVNGSLLGSMGRLRYKRGPESAEKKASLPKTPEDPRHVGVAGSMGGIRYGTKPKDAPPERVEGSVAGKMGSVHYAPKAPEPTPETDSRKKKKGPDKGILVAAAVTVTALAATVLLVFWNAIFGTAEIYGMGLGGFINYYKPIEEEDILEEEGVKYVGDQMVIVSAMNVSYQDMESFFSQRDMEIIGYVELIDTYQVQLNDSFTLTELHNMARELEKERLVDSATVNAVHENAGFAFPSDPWDGNSNWDQPGSSSGNWGVMAIRAPQSWDRWEPVDVRAGVVDSVFDESHPDLIFAMTKDNEIFPYVRDPDEQGHGTHVSGTIGAIHNNGICVAGVAENCRIYGYSTLRYEGVIEEVSAIAELAAQDVRVINYSMGLIPEIRDEAIARNGMERDIYYRFAAAFSQTAIKHLLQKGYDFLLVCAAGNDPVDASWASEYAYITDPTVREHILVVGAAGINRDGSYYQTSWSGLGSRVDVLGPGVDIFSTFPGGGAYMSGTSMATPHVTGVCASVWALNPSLSGAQVKRIVIQTADIPVPGGDANMVNMEAAMAAAAAA